VSAATVHYYVYYRVAAAHAAAARRSITGVLALLEQRVGVAGHLLRHQDEPLLWMEVYDAVHDPAAFEAALAELLVERGFASFLAPGSDRKIERFVAAA
jgi:hypothetical protein